MTVFKKIPGDMLCLIALLIELQSRGNDGFIEALNPVV
jgi:hypothetical protein